MSALDWIFTTTLFILYFFLLFTVCVMTFQKGHTLLGIIGIFLPILWLVGAFLPAKDGSRYALDQQIAQKQQMEQYTR